MNYSIVYEITDDKLNPFLIIPFFLTLLVFILLLFSFIKNKTIKVNSSQLVGIGFFVILLGLSIFNIFKIKEYQDIINDYENGEYYTIEGKIEKFTGLTEDHQQETFKVNNVKFAVPNNIGYSLTALTNSYIKGDGQYLRIGYMTIDDINYIVKLEIVNE